jgi:hypothetical protein
MLSTFRSLMLACMLLARAGTAFSQSFATTITPEQVVPPTPSTATGQGTLALGAGNMLSFEITIAGLHGAETEASIHGPAPAGSNVGSLFFLPLGNSKTGSVGPLTAAQVADLQAGLWYVMIHTTHHGSGEIRGQIRGTLGVEPGTWGRIKELYSGR